MNGEKIEAVSIDNQFHVVNIVRLRRSQQSPQRSLLLHSETVENVMTISQVQIAYDQLRCSHGHLICRVNSLTS
jgi:hypothetical protein